LYQPCDQLCCLNRPRRFGEVSKARRLYGQHARDQRVPFWFPISGDYIEELHGGALDLKNVPALQQVWLNIPSHYGRIWTLRA